MGNITYKSNTGTYYYGQNAGAQAVTTIKTPSGALTYSYDANGNQTAQYTNRKQTRSISYTSFGKPLQITTANAQTTYHYNANRKRFEKTNQQGTKTTTTYFMGNYEQETTTTPTQTTTTQKYYLAPNTLYTKTTTNGQTITNTYNLLTNNQGSITAITNKNCQTLQKYSYTPYGEQTQTKGQTTPITNKGYTGHEEIKSQNLIHMNGRLYDPTIGRFLSADPTIQHPTNTQNLNRYSYCGNNPINYTDPTGYNWWHHLWHSVGHFIGKHIKAILTTAAAAALTATGIGIILDAIYGGIAIAINGVTISTIGGEITGSTIAGAGATAIGKTISELGEQRQTEKNILTYANPTTNTKNQTEQGSTYPNNFLYTATSETTGTENISSEM